MASIFNTDNQFWQGMSRVADLILLNLLFLLTLVPVFTAGAAFAALYETARKLLNESGGGVARVYWNSFKSNFVQASAMFAVMGPLGALVVFGWILVPVDRVLALRVSLTLIYLLVFPYAFYLPTRFHNSFGNTLKNALLIPLSRLPYAAGALALTVLLVALIASTTAFVPQLLPPLLLAGFGLYAYAITPLLNQSVLPWTDASQR